MLKLKISGLFKAKKKNQVEYAELLGRTQQSFNNSIRRDQMKLTDFIRLCDWLGVDIVLYDHDTSERITDLNINDLKKD